MRHRDSNVTLETQGLNPKPSKPLNPKPLDYPTLAKAMLDQLGALSPENPLNLGVRLPKTGLLFRNIQPPQYPYMVNNWVSLL